MDRIVYVEFAGRRDQIGDAEDFFESRVIMDHDLACFRQVHAISHPQIWHISYNQSMTKNSLLAGLLAGLTLLTACAPKTPTPDPNAAIRQAVAATIAAIPSVTPYPTVAPYPSPTPSTLNGLFCEYNFCIGHPSDLAFFDVSAQQNPAAPSSYSQGLLAAFNPNLFIQLIWQYAPGTSDPQFLMDLSLEPGIDTSAGSFELKLIRNTNVLIHPIQSTASPLLPYGLVAGWVCGDRAFAWKIYTPQDGAADGLLQDTLNRFRCE